MIEESGSVESLGEVQPLGENEAEFDRMKQEKLGSELEKEIPDGEIKEDKSFLERTLEEFGDYSSLDTLGQQVVKEARAALDVIKDYIRGYKE